MSIKYEGQVGGWCSLTLAIIGMYLLAYVLQQTVTEKITKWTNLGKNWYLNIFLEVKPAKWNHNRTPEKNYIMCQQNTTCK